MTTRLEAGASHILGLLPFAQVLTKTPPSMQLLAAVALVRSPLLRRLSPRLAGIATVGLAAVAVVSFVKGLKHRTPRPSAPTNLDRASVT